jgi:asparagine synthase (glutamine-hydrolysing)
VRDRENLQPRRGAGRPRRARARTRDAIAHRGPDGSGVFVDGPVGLGNRRLAIIDLRDTAAQPIANETGEVVLTYYGELYNFRELRGRS